MRVSMACLWPGQTRLHFVPVPKPGSVTVSVPRPWMVDGQSALRAFIQRLPPLHATPATLMCAVQVRGKAPSIHVYV